MLTFEMGLFIGFLVGVIVAGIGYLGFMAFIASRSGAKVGE